VPAGERHFLAGADQLAQENASRPFAGLGFTELLQGHAAIALLVMTTSRI